MLWPAIWQVTEFLWGELHFEDEINVIEGYVNRLIGIDELRAISLIHTPDEFPNEDESAMEFVKLEADWSKDGVFTLVMGPGSLGSHPPGKPDCYETCLATRSENIRGCSLAFACDCFRCRVDLSRQAIRPYVRNGQFALRMRVVSISN